MRSSILVTFLLANLTLAHPFSSPAKRQSSPSGPRTDTILRPKVGSVPYGGDFGGVQHCSNGKVALTFDDGPYIWTHDLLDLLDRYGAKATFFINANNWGKLVDDCNTEYPALVKRMYDTGHQIASHTYSHADLSTLSPQAITDELIFNEMSLRNILGVIPTYMRPPYLSCSGACPQILGDLGYHVVWTDVNTEDWANDSPSLIGVARGNFDAAIGAGGRLVLNHDVHYQTVYNLAEYELQRIAALGLGTSVTVGQCLDDPPANWYRAAGAPTLPCVGGGGAPPPLPPPPGGGTPGGGGKQVSTDGQCGGGNGMTCLGSADGDCCSQWGWCGRTGEYCGGGCQREFGSCF